MAKSKKSKTIKVNMEGVEARVTIPEDDYAVKPVGATLEDGDKAQYIAWELEITEGEYEGKKLYTNTSLSENALWRLRTMLEAMGVEVPDGVMEIDLEEILKDEPEFGVTVAHEDYEGRPRAQVVECFPAKDAEEEKGSKKGGKDKEEEKSSKKDKKGGKDKEEEEKPDEDAINEMDEDELEEVVDNFDLDVDLDDHKKLKDKRKAVIKALEDAGDEDDKDEDDKKSYDEDSINEMGTKELQKIVDEADLGIELDGSTKSKRRAVIKALKKKGLLDD